MHTTRTTRTLAACLLAFGLAACSNAPGDTQTPPEQTTSPDPFQIDQPKNLKAINDPCRLLTPQQIQELGATNPEPGKSEWGQEQCTWRNQLQSVTVAPDTKQRLGLQYTTKIVADGKPTDKIEGYPAVHYMATELRCSTYVGTADEELFMIDFHTGYEGRNKPEFAEPCKVSDKIAGIVLSNLPPA